MSMSVVIHMATYLRPRHVLGILIGSQKQETFLSLPFSLSLSFPSTCATCSPQGRRRAGLVQREYRELGTGTGAVRIVRLLPVFLRILVYFLFFSPSASASSPRGQLRLDEFTPSEATRSRGHAHVRIVGRTPENLSVAKATTVRQAGRQHSFMLHANFPCTHSKTLLPIPAAPPRYTSNSLPFNPSQSCTCATPLLELTSSIFRIFCNTIFILYLRIFSALPLSLFLPLSLSRCTSSFVVVVAVAAGNRKP